MIHVPKDLLDDMRGAPVRSKRLLVAGWVLSYGLRGADEDRAWRVELRQVWPAHMLDRGGSLTVLSILLELEALGFVHSVDEDGAFLTLQRGGRKAASG